ncbi:MAG: hypothetical protein AAF546_12575 [Verrucomicrobiota bacterium]
MAESKKKHDCGINAISRQRNIQSPTVGSARVEMSTPAAKGFSVGFIFNWELAGKVLPSGSGYHERYKTPKCHE